MSLAQVVTLPWFLFRLGLVISPTLLKFAAIPARKYLHLILAIVFVATVISLHLWKSGLLFPTPPAPQTPQTQANLDQEIEYWENLYRLQPTHRDVLVNLAALYQLKGDEAKAQEYLGQAKQLDPNNPLFQN